MDWVGHFILCLILIPFHDAVENPGLNTLGSSSNISNNSLKGSSSNISNNSLEGSSSNIFNNSLEGRSSNIFNNSLEGSSSNISNNSLEGSSSNISNNSLEVFRSRLSKKRRSRFFVTSLNYPHDYPNNVDATYKIPVTPGSLITIRFLTFKIEKSWWSSRCPDWLMIKEEEESNIILDKTCGKSTQVFDNGKSNFVEFTPKLDTSNIEVMFHSDYLWGYAGFKLELYSDPNIIVSPNYPNVYNNDEEFIYPISTSRGHTIVILFLLFDLEQDDQCSFDWLKITEYSEVAGENIVLDKTCGQKESLVVRSKSNRVNIFFHTDGSERHKGFKLKWEATIANIELELAPNSYDAKLTSGEDLDTYAFPFERLKPILVFSRPTIFRSWKELKESIITNNLEDIIPGQAYQSLKDAKKLVIITHGASQDRDISNCNIDWLKEMSDSIISNDDQAFTLLMCWNSQISTRSHRTGKLCAASSLTSTTQGFYYNIAVSSAKVGEFLALVISTIKEKFSNIDYVHGIGHSLGAHVMGNVFNFGKVKMNRISGLDPAGPCFEEKQGDIRLSTGKWGLTPASADFVDNIHTDGNHFGTWLAKGHIDFFAGEVNDANKQPGCMTCVLGCCHAQAINYFQRTITEHSIFLTAYRTKNQDPNYSKKREIDENIHSQSLVKGGYYAKYDNHPRVMYLPVFKGNNGPYSWAGVCDRENLKDGDKENKYCKKSP